jgi:hypothetical protein
MRTRSKLILVGLGATLLFALNISAASARTLSIGPSQNFRGTFSDLEFKALEIRDDCHVTMEGSLHARTIAKVAGALLGYVTRVTIGQCSIGTTVLTETLPWHVRYESFSGTLPNITLLVIRQRGAFRASFCLSNTEFRGRFIVDGNPASPTYRRITGIEVPPQRIPTDICGQAEFRSVGNGSLSVLGTTEPVTVLLI